MTPKSLEENLEIISNLSSPFLVKEVRQLMRAPTFTRFFLFAHLLMLTTTLLDSLMGAIIIMGFMICLIQPARIGVSCRSEFDSSFYELLSLTGLSAWKLVTGKWLRGIFESMFLIVSALPYLLMTFFSGEMEYKDLLCVILIGLLVASATVSLSIAANANSNPTKKTFGSGIMNLFIVVAIFPSFSLIFYYKKFVHQIGLVEIIYIGMISLMITLLSLLHGAAKIAPPNENYAKPSRLLSVVFLIAFYWLVNDGPLGPLVFLVALQACLLVGFLACLQPGLTVSSRYKKFEKHPFQMYFLTPGWPSGVLFLGGVCLFLSLGGLLFSLSGVSPPSMMKALFSPYFYAAVFVTTVAPLVIALASKREPSLLQFLSVHAGFFVFITIIASLSPKSVSNLLFTISPVSYSLLAMEGKTELGYLMLIELIITLPILIWGLKAHFSKVRRTLEQS